MLALIAPLFIDAGVTNVVSGTGEKLAPPSLDDPLGTDESGRSVLLMIWWGSRTSLLIGFLAALLSMVIGTVLGIAAATSAAGSVPSSCASPTGSSSCRPWSPRSCSRRSEPLLVHRLAGPKKARRRVTELLEQVGLPSWRARSYPHELSGGQRQRVMIAMALACEPRLIIADEPTTALDLMVQAQVLTLIRELIAEHGISLLMISHDLSVLADICDRLAVMYAGRVVESGPSQGAFQHPYSQALAAAFPTVGDPASRLAPKGLGGDPPDPMQLPTGCVFHPRCPVALDECSTVEIDLCPAGDRRTAACVLASPLEERC